MKEALTDIRRKLQEGLYKNEEHVRFALVGRLLQALGWDIWNPCQVYAEYAAVPDEDKTKVDLALCLRPEAPAVFIEVKGVGKAAVNLERTEEQLRDYNRNITAPFCIISDGVSWRFYHSQSPGRFRDKCFKQLDLLTDDMEDLEQTLRTFLGKPEIENGNAEKEAKTLLKLTQKEKAMEACLSKARRLTQEPPFPSLPDALITLVAEDGYTITREEAEDFISNAPSRLPETTEEATTDTQETSIETPPGVRMLSPEHPGSLRFTSIDRAMLGTEAARNWNDLVCVGIKVALRSGKGVSDLRRSLTAQVEEGILEERGYHHIPGTNVSLQYVEATRAWENALALAKLLRCQIVVEFHWRSNEGATRPGERGVLRWSP